MKCGWLAAQHVSDLESRGRGAGSPSEDSRGTVSAIARAWEETTLGPPTTHRLVAIRRATSNRSKTWTPSTPRIRKWSTRR